MYFVFIYFSSGKDASNLNVALKGVLYMKQPAISLGNADKVNTNFDIANVLRVMATLFVFVLHGRSNISGIQDVPFLSFITSLPAWAGVWIFFVFVRIHVGPWFF